MSKVPQAIILAAGESSRFWPLNYKHKGLFKIMGKPLIWYTIDGLRRAGIRDIIICQDSRKEIEKELKDPKIKYIIQQKPKGMGNALWQAKKFIRDSFFVLNAERVDTQEIIQNSKIKNQNYNPKFKAVLFGQKTKTPQLFGIMKLKGNRVAGIVEKSKKTPPSNIRVVGVYFLEPDFFKYYQKVKKHHYDFEDALSLYIKEKEVGVQLLKGPEEKTPILKYPWHIFNITRYLFDKYLKKDEVRLGKNVKVYEGAIIKGPCYIGSNCLIGNNSVVRDYTNLENNVWVGALTEVTRSVFQEDSHCHSGYFGDSAIGEHCRLGAGVITANVRFDKGEIRSLVKGEKVGTGLTSLGAIIGRNTKVGVNASLMPGVFIGSDCVVGPNALVRKNLENKKTLF